MVLRYPQRGMDAQMRVLLSLKGDAAAFPRCSTAPPRRSSRPSCRPAAWPACSWPITTWGRSSIRLTPSPARSRRWTSSRWCNGPWRRLPGPPGARSRRLISAGTCWAARPAADADRPVQPTRRDDVHAQMLFAAGVRDAESLDRALGRIHAAASQGDKELRRQMLGANIYVLPGSPGSLVALGSGMLGGGAASARALPSRATSSSWAPRPAWTAMRDTHSEEVSSVKSDPLFGRTAHHLPGEASLWFYQDKRRRWSACGTRSARPRARRRPRRTCTAQRRLKASETTWPMRPKPSRTSNR